MMHHFFCQTVKNRLFQLCTFLVLLCSCHSPHIDLEQYYYPIDKLAGGLIYEYQSDNLSIAPGYWYYSTAKKGDTVMLLSQNLDPFLNVKQMAIERRVKNGMLLMSNNIFLKDSTGQQKKINVEIIEKNLFPFSVKDTNGIFLYKVKWFSEKDKHTTVIRNRRFLGFDELEFKGKPVKCAKFELKELIEDYNNGYIEYPFKGVEYYGLGIGLLKYEKIVNANLKLSYYLKDIYTINEFEKKFNKKFPQ